MESSVAPSEPLSRVLAIYSTTHRSASGFCPDGMPRAGRSAGASNGQWQGDERRLPEIFQGSKRRGSDRSIGGPADGSSPHAGGHQTRGGCASNREAILRLQSIREGLSRREERGVPRDHARRALRCIQEGRVGVAIANRLDASTWPAAACNRDAPYASGE